MSSTTRLPILIGITGKRNLTDTQTASVLGRLERLFRRLDADFPLVPKVLLTGAAYGADMIAAELLTRGGEGGLARFPDWSLVALLPFSQDLFEKDFRSPAAANAEVADRALQRLARLRRLLANPRVRVRELPPLHVSADIADGLVDRIQLDRDNPDADATLRHRHYEQVGQCISELATILIAVMDGGEVANGNEADGGTARVVAFRRSGRPDEHGRVVASCSDVLRNDWGTLVDPPAGHVWLIEPDHMSDTDGYPVVVLSPRDEVSDEDAYAQPACLDHGKGPRSWRGVLWRNPDRKRPLRESLTIPKAFERECELRSIVIRASERRQEITARVPKWVPFRSSIAEGLGLLPTRRVGKIDQLAPPLDAGDAEPDEIIQDVRASLSLVQGNAKSKSDSAFRAVATLFVAAVIWLEIFSKFLPTDPKVLALYLLSLVTMFATVLHARNKRWQPLSEDYRAVNEMLRVQRVWWAAGLAYRVDHLHLQAADPELSRIREAVRAILGWIWLRSDWPTSAPRRIDWSLVRGHQTSARTRGELSKGKPPVDWIGAQIAYFAKNHAVYHRKVKGLAAITWSLFASSVWLAVLLLVWLVSNDSRHYFTTVAGRAHLLSLGTWSPASGVIVWTLLTWAWFRLCGWLARRTEPTGHGTWLGSLPTALTGLVGALLCALAIQSGASLLVALAWMTDDAEAAKDLTVFAFVTLSAIAGSTHYLSEKLNLVAQSMEYRDALGRFERAERLLAAGADGTGAPADVVAAQQVIRDLAMLALRENEVWLKARRERPLSPVVG